MKKIITATFLILVSEFLYSQDLTKFKLYNPEENAAAGINNAVKLAKEKGKHVFIQIGGNWCIWCARFDDFIKTDQRIDSLIKADFVVYHLNYSKENYNPKILARYGFPQRFGFPVFLILDGSGKLIHTQNSSYLEDGKKSYNRENIIGFLKDWRPSSLDTQQYKEQ